MLGVRGHGEEEGRELEGRPVPGMTEDDRGAENEQRVRKKRNDRF